MEPDLELLRQADQILSKCGGRRKLPDGTVVVPLEKKFLMPMLLEPNQTTVFTKQITGDTTWSLRAIASDQTSNQVTGVRLQIQLPNGRFLLGGNGIDIGQFAWVGSYRWSQNPELECNPGSKFQVALTDMVGLGSAFPCNLLFEGCYNYYLRGGKRVPPPPPGASGEDRYQGTVNENILAPCYVAGYGPATPAGFEDTQFTYSSPPVTLPVGGPIFQTVKIPIDRGLTFQLRRVLVDVQTDPTVSAGVVLGRLRAGAGYALNDDFIDLARYLNGAEFPHDWKVRGADAVYADLQLADFAGSGNFYVQIHLEGVRRRSV
jgi:hypothetical protein